MRELYIMNPSAGKNGASGFSEQVHAYHAANGGAYALEITKYPGHAAALAKAAAESGGEIRIWAVGGDGTLSEVCEGAAGHKNAAVGVFPYGSGNDFVRSFGGRGPFLDIVRQHGARERTVDMIRTDCGLGVGICSLGFDAKVAERMTRYKSIPGVSGSLAYILSLVCSLFGRISDELEIELVNESGETERFSGDYVFALAGNAKWYGGGFCGSPNSVLDDGLLDFVLIEKPPLWKIPQMIGIYKAGKHLADARFAPYLTYRRGTRIEMRGKGSLVSNIDGNCVRVDGAERFEILPGALRFLVPEGAAFGKENGA